MSGTEDEKLAAIERALEVDSRARAEVLRTRAVAFAYEHAAVLRLARPLIVELLALGIAELEVATGGTSVDTNLLDALSIVLDEPRLRFTLPARVARAVATVSTHAVRQERRAKTAPAADDAPARMN